jgi:hypothetical protein
MTYQGHFQNGVVVLDEAAVQPDGVKVRVEVLPSNESEQGAERTGGTLSDHYKAVIGAAQDLPADFAAEHDHYVHGTPKGSESDSPSRTIAERLSNVIAKGIGLPSDFAENHDHYIHGAPKE